MPTCANCGTENPSEARFCMSCAAPLAVEQAREQRKVVTVLFCDLVGSTALGESTDPEALRARMRRYFEDLRVILERHGGTVEKFVGDAVMAVFGIPVSHEDDALRAVRAAAEMQAAIAAQGLEARIGVNTGEVVVGGESETLVTGDAVNVAARLEQAAGAGAVYIGAETHSLVRDAVRVDVVEPLALKGKAQPIDAYSLLEVLPESEGLARNPEALLVGRKRERNRLWRDFEDVIEESSCRLVTLLGPAGIGKSRLVADFVERIGDVGGHPARPLPLVRRGDHLLAARRDPDCHRSRARLRDRHLSARDPARVQTASRGTGRRSDRRSSSSTICSGPSRSSSTSSSTSPTSRVTRRSSSSASRAPSSSTSARLGRRQAERDLDPARAARRRRM